MSLVEGISKDTAKAAVDELAKDFAPELDADLQHFAKTFADELVDRLGALLIGKTLTITVKLGENQ